MDNLLQRTEKMAEIAERMLSTYQAKQPFSVTAEEHQVFFEESLRAAGATVEDLLAAKERYEKKVVARRLSIVPSEANNG